MKCAKCNTPLKLLFTSWYCPKECDKPSKDDDWLAEVQLMLDEDDEPTQPSWPRLVSPDGSPLPKGCPACLATYLYYGQNGNIIGWWCNSCGRLVQGKVTPSP